MKTEKEMYNILILNNIKYGVLMKNTVEYSEFPEKISLIPKSKNWVIGMVKVKNELVPMIDLAKRFSIEKKIKIKDSITLTVKSSNETKCCIIFDKNDSQIEIEKDEIKSPTINPSGINNDFIKGYCYIDKSDGKKDMLMILNIDELIDQKYYIGFYPVKVNQFNFKKLSGFFL